jgi:hypothetical protein
MKSLFDFEILVLNFENLYLYLYLKNVFILVLKT